MRVNDCVNSHWPNYLVNNNVLTFDKSHGRDLPSREHNCLSKRNISEFQHIHFLFRIKLQESEEEALWSLDFRSHNKAPPQSLILSFWEQFKTPVCVSPWLTFLDSPMPNSKSAMIYLMHSKLHTESIEKHFMLKKKRKGTPEKFRNAKKAKKNGEKNETKQRVCLQIKSTD